MAVPSKSAATDLFAIAQVSSATISVGTAQDCSGKFAALIAVFIGRRATSALTVPAQIRIEVSTASSGDETWVPLAIFSSTTDAAESEAITSTSTTSPGVASTTNLTAGDIVFFDNSTIGNARWRRIKSIVSNTSISPEDALDASQNGTTIYDQGNIISGIFGLEGCMRIRAVVDNSGTGQNIAVKVNMAYLDSIG